MKAQAMQEAAQSIEGLLGEESLRLHSAQQDVMGSQDPAFVLAMVLSELARVAAAQDERITTLEKELKKAQPRPAK